MTKLKNQEEAFYATYFDKIVEVESHLEEYILKMSSMLSEDRLNVRELIIRTQLVVLPINEAVMMSEQYLEEAKDMLLPPTQNMFTPNLLRMIDGDLVSLVSQILSMVQSDTLTPICTMFPIPDNASLKLLSDTMSYNVNLGEMLMDMVKAGKALSENIRKVRAVFTTVDPEIVCKRFDEMFDAFCKDNAYLQTRYNQRFEIRCLHWTTLTISLPTRGLGMVIIAKNREGRLYEEVVRWVGKCTLYYEDDRHMQALWDKINAVTGTSGGSDPQPAPQPVQTTIDFTALM